jgi:hypothetical protein
VNLVLVVAVGSQGSRAVKSRLVGQACFGNGEEQSPLDGVMSIHVSPPFMERMCSASFATAPHGDGGNASGNRHVGVR